MEKRRIGVRAIFIKDGTLLAVKHKANDGTPKDFWVIPGGGLDPHESLEAGLKREMLEELNVEIEVQRLLFIQQFASGRPDRDEELEFLFLVKNIGTTSETDFSQSSHGMAELAACEYINPHTERILPTLFNEIDLVDYAENIRPVLLWNELEEK